MDNGGSLSAAVLAALAAVTALYAEHFATEAMLEEIQANDKWSEFQANSTKEKVILSSKHILTKLEKELDPEDEKELEKYKKHKDEIRKEAEDLKKESIKHFAEHRPLSRGLTMFQVAIAIGAISVLTKRRGFWFVALAFRTFGIGFLVGD